MHFHKHEQYGLLFMGELACQKGSDPLSLLKMSKRHGVSLPFLKKIVRSLKSHGLVNSKEGIGGGYTLARSADSISMWDIVSSYDPASHDEKLRGLVCPVNTSCLPQHIRNILTQRIKEQLATISLQEVIV